MYCAKYLKNYLALAATIVAFLPCEANAVKAVKTGYLQDYARLRHVGGVPIEQVWIDTDFNSKDFATLYVMPVQVDPGTTRNPQQMAAAQDLAKLMQNDMIERFRTAEMFNLVSGESFLKKGDKNVLVLQTRITIIDNGSPLRIFGIGPKAPTVQLEGKFFDARYKRTFIEFADRRANIGNYLLLGFCNTTNGDVLNGISLKNMSKALVDLVAYTKENQSLAERKPSH